MVYCEHDIAILQKMTRYDYHQIYYHGITILLPIPTRELALVQQCASQRLSSSSLIKWTCLLGCFFFQAVIYMYKLVVVAAIFIIVTNTMRSSWVPPLTIPPSASITYCLCN